MSIYHTHTTQEGLYFYPLYKTPFAVASLHKATLHEAKSQYFVKKEKLYEVCERYITPNDTCSYRKSHHHCQSGQWAWVNCDQNCTQTCTHAHAK